MVLSKTMDRTYATLKDKAGGVGKPEFRLREGNSMDTSSFHKLIAGLKHPWYPEPSFSQPVSSSQVGRHKQKRIGSVLTSCVVEFLYFNQ